MKFQTFAIGSMLSCIALFGLSTLTTSNTAWAKPLENPGPTNPSVGGPYNGRGGLQDPSVLICNNTDNPVSYRINRKEVPTLEPGRCWKHSNYDSPMRVSFDASYEPGLQMTRYNVEEGFSYHFGPNSTRSGINLFRD